MKAATVTTKPPSSRGKSAAAGKTRKQPAWDFERLAQAVVTNCAAQANDETASSKLPSGLYLVATPIGHRGDITLRGLAVLTSVDAVLAEDTRVSGALLRGYGVRTALTAYHDHNADRVRPAILAQLRDGAALALVSDAGMPLVADPGFKLVRDCVAADIPVTVIPGPSATLTALALSGLPCDAFHFAGFLPAKSTARRAALAELRDIQGSIILFESPARLAASLADMAAVLGPRDAAVARELTKLFEEVRRGPLPDLAQSYAATPAKGEVVVVIAPPMAMAPTVDLDEALRTALAQYSLRDAVSAVASATGLAKRLVYARALALHDGALPDGSGAGDHDAG